MAVRRIKGSWHIDVWYRGARHRRKSPKDNLVEARAFERRFLEKLERARLLDLRDPFDLDPGVRYEAYARAWFQAYVKANTRPSTQIGYESTLRRALLPFFGGSSLEDITTLSIETFKRLQLDAGVSPKSLNNLLAVLRRSLVCAQEWGIIPMMPRVQFLRVPEPRYQYLTREESERLLASEQRPEWRLFFLAALRTGMRTCELLGLHWEDVNFEVGQLHVRRDLVSGIEGGIKNGRTRIIPLCDDLHTALEPRRRESGHVFTQPDGSPQTWLRAYRALQETCRAASIKAIGLHALRHTFTTQLGRKKVSILVVKNLLGHSSLAMTERYMHLEEEEVREAIART